MAYLYHIKLPGMSLHEGYIGISKCYETRWKQHEHAAHNLMSPYIVHQNMRRYKDEYVKEVIAEGTVQEVFDQEYALRPNWMMAWNMAQGGGAAGSGWIQPDSWISNELWHPVHGERTLNRNFTAMDACILTGNGSTKASQVVKVLKGMSYEAHGWQLRDAQLARQVKTWIETPWISVYLSNSNENVLVYNNGQKEFWNMIGGRSTGNGMKLVAKGERSSVYNWNKVTKEEYEANPGRVFGTPEEET